MNTLIALLAVSLSAHAYGPSSKILKEENYACELRTEQGEQLHATMQRRLWDIVRKPGTRMLISSLKLSDGTGFETGTGNLDKLLAPHFGRASFDESGVSVELENVTGDKNLVMQNLASQEKSQAHAWGSQSPDDMTIATKLEGGDSPYVEVTFATRQRALEFQGQCLLGN